jgi:peptide/nickel transport system permease protein
MSGTRLRILARRGLSLKTTQVASTPLVVRPRAGQPAWVRSLRRNSVGVIGLVIVVTVLITALLAPLLAPHDPAQINVRSRLLPPAWSAEGDLRFILGTDQLGRDVLSRLIFGSRVSVIVGILGVAISVLIGVTIGLISGYVGGFVDNILSRAVDTFMAIPFIILALAAVGFLGPGLFNLIIVLGITGWVTFARVVRGEVLSVKGMEYVIAARTVGQVGWRIALSHVLPNVTASIIVLATLQIATVIIAESSLSFLGMGVQPPTITWGVMLSEGRNHLATSWWLATFPGVAISLTALGAILMGDWLRDALDPRLRQG